MGHGSKSSGDRAGREASFESLRKLRKLGGLMGSADYRGALRSGVAAATEHRRLPYPATTRSVIDLGAHRGQFAVFALHAFPDARVHCFEPLPDALAALKRTVGVSPRVSIHEVAASDVTGEQATMHVSRADDSSSLLPIEDRYVTAFPGTEESGTAVVSTTRVDEALSADDLPGPTLLKVDVQGFELQALSGCERLLPTIGQIVVEVSFVELYGGQALAGAVTAHLNDRGFELTGAYNVKRDRAGRCLQSDFLFERREPGR